MAFDYTIIKIPHEIPDLSVLPAEERAIGQKNHARAWSFILTRRILGKCLNKEPLIIREAGKKPVCKDIEFSVSHSHDYWGIAWSFEHALGFDLQFKDPKVNYQLICKHFFPKETVHTLDDFYALWTKKEAAVKCLGTSIFSNPDMRSFIFHAIPCPIHYCAHLAVIGK